MSVRWRIGLSEPLDAAAEGRLAAGAELLRAASRDEDELVRLAAACDALLVRSSTRVTRRVLEAGGALRVVATASVGTDHIDVAAAEACGIHVINAPLANADSVAEFTVGLMLQMLRPIPRLAGQYAEGWFAAARERPHGRELRELTVGIIGMGRVGSRVGRICAAGFGARVLYNDIVPVGPFAFGATAVEQAELLAGSDVVTLHVPLTAETRGMIDAAALARMRPGSYLVNTARGAVVAAGALADALRSAALAGAALDVTDPEPLPRTHTLWTCPNCILTPHVAARTHGALARMYAVADELLSWLACTGR
ncbi:MAG: Hydroxypyruvate reductase [Phycisphaerae bacterium]|nr:Hydroxypyruvate reductase [Phycisphaerae bacterium]